MCQPCVNRELVLYKIAKTPKQIKSFKLNHDNKYSSLHVMIIPKLCNELFAWNTVVAHCAKVTSNFDDVLYIVQCALFTSCIVYIYLCMIICLWGAALLCANYGILPCAAPF